MSLFKNPRIINDKNIKDPRKLPGFIKKSFWMSVDGGDVWFEHLDGIYEYETLVVEKLISDYETFRYPSMPSLIAVNLYETMITDNIIDNIAEKLTGKKHFTRVVFVGADKISRHCIRRSLSKRNSTFALAFIDDFQKAKEWLVSENI